MQITIDPHILANIVQLNQARESAPEKEQYPIVELLCQARKQIFDANGYDPTNPNFEAILEAMQEKIIDDYGKDSEEYRALFGMRPYDF